MARRIGETEPEVVGVVPLAGQATRLAPLPFSKELYPVGFHPAVGAGAARPKVACAYLLDQLRRAGVARAYLVLRPGKWDIPAYLGDGASVGMKLAYLMMGLPHGPPYTVDQAYPFVRHALVAFGFPDIILEPEDVLARVVARQRRGGADVVVGTVPTETPHKAGVVDAEADGRVRRIIEKPPQSDLRAVWVAAAWGPRFTEFLHDDLARREAARAAPESGAPAAPGRDLPMGDVFQAAIDNGLRVEAEHIADGRYLDIGTPADLAEAVRRYGRLSDGPAEAG